MRIPCDRVGKVLKKVLEVCGPFDAASRIWHTICDFIAAKRLDVDAFFTAKYSPSVECGLKNVASPIDF
jgi:hypothetical protein